MSKEIKFNANGTEITLTITDKGQVIPPSGYKIARIPIERTQAAAWDIIPELIMWRKVGSRKQLVYMYPLSLVEYAAYQKGFYSEAKRADRQKRCMVTGKLGKPIVCRKTSCQNCPHAGDVMNTATIASLEQMHEDINFEISCGDTTVNQVQGEMLINSLATDLSNVDERLGLILRLSDQGYSPKDIAEELSIKTSTLYYCLKRIQRIARELGYIS